MPTFRQVLLERFDEVKTASGLYIPASVADGKAPDEVTWRVVKVGKDCTEAKPGDIAYIIRGIFPESVGEYYQVMEQQIKGLERDDGIRDAPAGKPKVTRGRKLQKR